MIPVEHDFIDERGVWVGDNWARQFTYADDAGQGIDLSGWTVSFVIRDLAGSTLLTLTSPSSGVTLGATGVFTVSLTPAQTTTIGAQTCTYALRLSSGSADQTLAVGRIAFLAGL